MKSTLSKTQIDRLGDRLKIGRLTDSDLQMLDDYRRSFGDAYESVLQIIRNHGQFPTGRLAKSTPSIVDKLRRESIRLSQMQDIAGCRVIVANIVEQDELVATMKAEFPRASIVDRRDNPSYGYRAVHIIVEISGKSVEIQIRSTLQHLWAELSEKASDVLDRTIKYGGGPEKWKYILIQSSVLEAVAEELERMLFKAESFSHGMAYADRGGSRNSFEEFLTYHQPKWVIKLKELRTMLEDITKSNINLSDNIKYAREALSSVNKSVFGLLSKLVSSLDQLKEQNP